MRIRQLVPPRSLVLAAFLLASMAAVAGGRSGSPAASGLSPLPVQAASCFGAAAGIVEPGACVTQEAVL